MPTNDFFGTLLLFLVLLNPFLMSVYLVDLIAELNLKLFGQVLVRASVISFFAFGLFTVFGEKMFTDVLQVEFSSFLVFGGIVFLVIALRHLFQGSEAIRQIRGGSAEHLAGSVAMPFMIGPGTISASVWTGSSLGPVWGLGVVISALLISLAALLLFKVLYDQMRKNYQPLLERYFDIAGRISALWVGTFAIKMVLTGLQDWGVFAGKITG